MIFAIIVTILAIIYVVSPFDFIPSIIPVLSVFDDLLAIAFAIFAWILRIFIPRKRN